MSNRMVQIVVGLLIGIPGTLPAGLAEAATEPEALRVAHGTPAQDLRVVRVPREAAAPDFAAAPPLRVSRAVPGEGPPAFSYVTTRVEPPVLSLGGSIDSRRSAPDLPSPAGTVVAIRPAEPAGPDPRGVTARLARDVAIGLPAIEPASEPLSPLAGATVTRDRVERAGVASGVEAIAPPLQVVEGSGVVVARAPERLAPLATGEATRPVPEPGTLEASWTEAPIEAAGLLVPAPSVAPAPEASQPGDASPGSAVEGGLAFAIAPVGPRPILEADASVTVLPPLPPLPSAGIRDLPPLGFVVEAAWGEGFADSVRATGIFGQPVVVQAGKDAGSPRFLVRVVPLAPSVTVETPEDLSRPLPPGVTVEVPEGLSIDVRHLSASPLPPALGPVRVLVHVPLGGPPLGLGAMPRGAPTPFPVERSTPFVYAGIEADAGDAPPTSFHLLLKASTGPGRDAYHAEINLTDDVFDGLPAPLASLAPPAPKTLGVHLGTYTGEASRSDPLAWDVSDVSRVLARFTPPPVGSVLDVETTRNGSASEALARWRATARSTADVLVVTDEDSPSLRTALHATIDLPRWLDSRLARGADGRLEFGYGTDAPMRFLTVALDAPAGVAAAVDASDLPVSASFTLDPAARVLDFAPSSPLGRIAIAAFDAMGLGGSPYALAEAQAERVPGFTATWTADGLTFRTRPGTELGLLRLALSSDAATLAPAAGCDHLLVETGGGVERLAAELTGVRVAEARVTGDAFLLQFEAAERTFCGGFLRHAIGGDETARLVVEKRPASVSLRATGLSSDRLDVGYAASSRIERLAFEAATPALGALAVTLDGIPRAFSLSHERRGALAYESGEILRRLSARLDNAAGIEGTPFTHVAVDVGSIPAFTASWSPERATFRTLGGTLGSFDVHASSDGLQRRLDASRDYLAVHDVDPAPGGGPLTWMSVHVTGIREVELEPGASGLDHLAARADPRPLVLSYERARSDPESPTGTTGLRVVAVVRDRPAHVQIAATLAGGRLLLEYDASAPIASIEADFLDFASGELDQVRLVAIPPAFSLAFDPAGRLAFETQQPLGRIIVLATRPSAFPGTPFNYARVEVASLPSFEARWDESGGAFRTGGAPVASVEALLSSDGKGHRHDGPEDYVALRRAADVTFLSALARGVSSVGFRDDGRTLAVGFSGEKRTTLVRLEDLAGADPITAHARVADRPAVFNATVVRSGGARTDFAYHASDVIGSLDASVALHATGIRAVARVEEIPRTLSVALDPVAGRVSFETPGVVARATATVSSPAPLGSTPYRFAAVEAFSIPSAEVRWTTSGGSLRTGGAALGEVRAYASSDGLLRDREGPEDYVLIHDAPGLHYLSARARGINSGSFAKAPAGGLAFSFEGEPLPTVVNLEDLDAPFPTSTFVEVRDRPSAMSLRTAPEPGGRVLVTYHASDRIASVRGVVVNHTSETTARATVEGVPSDFALLVDPEGRVGFETPLPVDRLHVSLDANHTLGSGRYRIAEVEATSIPTSEIRWSASGGSYRAAGGALGEVRIHASSDGSIHAYEGGEDAVVLHQAPDLHYVAVRARGVEVASFEKDGSGSVALEYAGAALPTVVIVEDTESDEPGSLYLSVLDRPAAFTLSAAPGVSGASLVSYRASGPIERVGATVWRPNDGIQANAILEGVPPTFALTLDPEGRFAFETPDRLGRLQATVAAAPGSTLGGTRFAFASVEATSVPGTEIRWSEEGGALRTDGAPIEELRVHASSDGYLHLWPGDEDYVLLADRADVAYVSAVVRGLREASFRQAGSATEVRVEAASAPTVLRFENAEKGLEVAVDVRNRPKSLHLKAEETPTGRVLVTYAASDRILSVDATVENAQTGIRTEVALQGVPPVFVLDADPEGRLLFDSPTILHRLDATVTADAPLGASPFTFATVSATGIPTTEIRWSPEGGSIRTVGAALGEVRAYASSDGAVHDYAGPSGDDFVLLHNEKGLHYVSARVRGIASASFAKAQDGGVALEFAGASHPTAVQFNALDVEEPVAVLARVQDRPGGFALTTARGEGDRILLAYRATEPIERIDAAVAFPSRRTTLRAEVLDIPASFALAFDPEGRLLLETLAPLGGIFAVVRSAGTLGTSPFNYARIEATDVPGAEIRWSDTGGSLRTSGAAIGALKVFAASDGAAHVWSGEEDFVLLKRSAALTYVSASLRGLSDASFSTGGGASELRALAGAHPQVLRFEDEAASLLLHARIEDRPANLTLAATQAAGNRTLVHYRASAPIGKLDARFTNVSSGLLANVTLEGLPATMSLDLDPTRGRALLDADAPIGRVLANVTAAGTFGTSPYAFASIEATAIPGSEIRWSPSGGSYRSSGAPLGELRVFASSDGAAYEYGDAFDYVLLHDAPTLHYVSARIRGLAAASFEEAGGNVAFAFRGEPQPTYVSFEDYDGQIPLRAVASILDRPANVSATLSRGEGNRTLLAYQASGPVVQLGTFVERADTGFVAQATLSGVPESLVVDFDPSGRLLFDTPGNLSSFHASATVPDGATFSPGSKFNFAQVQLASVPSVEVRWGEDGGWLRTAGAPIGELVAFASSDGASHPLMAENGDPDYVVILDEPGVSAVSARVRRLSEAAFERAGDSLRLSARGESWPTAIRAATESLGVEALLEDRPERIDLQFRKDPATGGTLSAASAVSSKESSPPPSEIGLPPPPAGPPMGLPPPPDRIHVQYAASGGIDVLTATVKDLGSGDVASFHLLEIPAAFTISHDPAGRLSFETPGKLGLLVATLVPKETLPGTRYNVASLAIASLPATEIRWSDAGASVRTDGARIGSIEAYLSSDGELHPCSSQKCPEDHDYAILVDKTGVAYASLRVRGLEEVAVTRGAGVESLRFAGQSRPMIVSVESHEDGVKGDLRIHKRPSGLDLSIVQDEGRRLLASYRASKPIADVEFSLVDGPKRRTVEARVGGIPSAFHVAFDPEGSRLGFDTLEPLGYLSVQATQSFGTFPGTPYSAANVTVTHVPSFAATWGPAGLDVRAAGGGIGEIEAFATSSDSYTLPDPDHDGLVLFDTPQEKRIGARVTGLRTASLHQGNGMTQVRFDAASRPTQIEIERERDPFVFAQGFANLELLDGFTEKTFVSVTDRPGSFGLVQAGGALAYAASDEIGHLHVSTDHQTDTQSEKGLGSRSMSLNAFGIPRELRLVVDEAAKVVSYNASGPIDDLYLNAYLPKPSQGAAPPAFRVLHATAIGLPRSLSASWTEGEKGPEAVIVNTAGGPLKDLYLFTATDTSEILDYEPEFHGANYVRLEKWEGAVACGVGGDGCDAAAPEHHRIALRLRDIVGAQFTNVAGVVAATLSTTPSESRGGGSGPELAVLLKESEPQWSHGPWTAVKLWPLPARISFATDGTGTFRLEGTEELSGATVEKVAPYHTGCVYEWDAPCASLAATGLPHAFSLDLESAGRAAWRATGSTDSVKFNAFGGSAAGLRLALGGIPREMDARWGNPKDVSFTTQPHPLESVSIKRWKTPGEFTLSEEKYSGDHVFAKNGLHAPTNVVRDDLQVKLSRVREITLDGNAGPRGGRTVLEAKLERDGGLRVWTEDSLEHGIRFHTLLLPWSLRLEMKLSDDPGDDRTDFNECTCDTRFARWLHYSALGAMDASFEVVAGVGPPSRFVFGSEGRPIHLPSSMWVLWTEASLNPLRLTWTFSEPILAPFDIQIWDWNAERHGPNLYRVHSVDESGNHDSGARLSKFMRVTINVPYKSGWFDTHWTTWNDATDLLMRATLDLRLAYQMVTEEKLQAIFTGTSEDWQGWGGKASFSPANAGPLEIPDEDTPDPGDCRGRFELIAVDALLAIDWNLEWYDDDSDPGKYECIEAI